MATSSASNHVDKETAAVAASPSTAAGATPSRIHMQLGSTRNRKRKRIAVAAATTLSGSSSSSSSDEEDENNTVTPFSLSETNASTATSQQQQGGWRVKLYRLNVDGSWDDCGTGRILCYFQKHKQSQQSQQQQEQDALLYQQLGEPTLVMQEEASPRVLLRTRILLRDAYQRQGDNIITWCEPYFELQSSASVDLALSFQDNAGCLDIWRQITMVQSRAAEWFRAHHHQQQQQLHHSTKSQQENDNDHHGEEQSVPHAVTTHSPQQQQQHPHHHSLWMTEHDNSNNNNNESTEHGFTDKQQQQHLFRNDSTNTEPMAVNMAAYGNDQQQQHHEQPKLPNPPTLSNLEEIADTIAAAQLQLRDALAMYISQNECSYLKALLSLFPFCESKGDYGALATLAACIKTVLLLNDPSIIELIVSDQVIFENVCSVLEYDPDLRDKANHRWFLRERAKFRTVVKMENEELVETIHRSFRVTYLRDTLLRPTMDEGSLSTLTSMQTFTHGHVVKGVTSSPQIQQETQQRGDSYLVQIIRVLGKEVNAITDMEWKELETRESEGMSSLTSMERHDMPSSREPTNNPSAQASWKQHLAPQDGSLASRKNRRRGCLSFLRELFNMVRVSLQQSDRDDFYTAIVCMEVDLEEATNKTPVSPKNNGTQESNKSQEEEEKSQQSEQEKSQQPEQEKSQQSEQQKSQQSEQNGDETKRITDSSDKISESSVNLLALLGAVLSDPNADVSEKGAVLEIISAIAMHDPSLVRRYCLDLQELWKHSSANRIEMNATSPARPSPNEHRQVIFRCPSNDLLLSLLFSLTIETDAGLLLQTSEIMRIILDTDLLGEHGPVGMGPGGEENEGVVPGGLHPSTEQTNTHIGGSDAAAGSEQNNFLSMFYEHYIYWLVAPFQFTILHPVKVVPDSIFSSPASSPLMTKILDTFKNGVSFPDPLLHAVPPCAIRSSFAVELLNFCVRAHLFRMKFFLLKSRVLGSVLKVLAPTPASSVTSGDRCLKLAAIRFLRAILSVKDEFYHRHIIQHNLFAPVFEAFRANPVGDNLVSSAIIEMCDYIHNQDIKSLIEYIVSKHLLPTPETSSSPKSTTSQQEPSLEDVATPYVNTLTVLRKAYEDSVTASKMSTDQHNQDENVSSNGDSNSRYFPGMRPRMNMSEKALEDQRKFREADEEESYFDADDDDEEQQPQQRQPPPVVTVDEVPENELHRTPRMFSLAQSPLLDNNSDSSTQKPGPSENDNGGNISGTLSSVEATLESKEEAEKPTPKQQL